ncbi:DNA-binding response regulator [Luteibacter rhizovicinus DSM 16549]|jgi:DNA-binding response OmpR family regulator|uniref:DNA-binding response regulator n=1 Tax=Luteibacter rhizovicinus DSM 16549 TaxID=1440763 RepID=A0A0G9H5C5_9GAMM|nr:response regulator transcription factor [Luteibacter rhizovicinus]APG05709.1 DNA-binding response regulator [Luteibacter rhizovicinus DSM 16549]KLD64641.1 transcriptional regulator [Luteibacter rhizovicinus DSM 16549]
MRILLVEDEPEMAAALQAGLHRHGMLVDIAPDIAHATEALQCKVHDLLLLDRQLPDGDGATLLIKARATHADLPVIMLTARGSLADRIDGLDLGADDYLVKPFAIEELLARIRAISRRPAKIALPLATVGNLCFDFTAREALVDGQPLRLQRRQLLLLETLAYRHGRTVQREVLQEAVYGFDDAIQSNALDAHVSKLRRALVEASASVEIHVIRGVGYLLREVRDGQAR